MFARPPGLVARPPGLVTGAPGLVAGAAGLISGAAPGQTGHGTLLTACQVLALCCGALAAWATAHHIRPWSQGGATSLEELALFCHVHHHYFIHLLGWIITGDPNATLHFTHPGGWLTLHSPLPGR